MKQVKNSVALTLMVSSVVLLIALQFFWLRSSYEQAFHDFRRESTVLFRTTLFTLRDSMFVKNIEPIRGDSLAFAMLPRKTDSVRVRVVQRDTFKIRERESKMQVYISSEHADSDATFLRPLASTIHKLEGQRSFIIRMGPDTLSIDTLSLHYDKTLKKSGVRSAFKIIHTAFPPPISRVERRMRMPGDAGPETFDQVKIYRDTLYTDNVHLNPMHAYAAVFPGMRLNVVKKITPQILFSAFLTAVIIASFVVMYRNLRAQQRMMRMKNDFISNVTHELKTPVATVSVALEALKNFHALENRERTKEYLAIAQNELNRLTLMTDKILKASVFESQGISFIAERVNIDKIIEQVLMSLKVVFEKKNLIVNYSPIGVHFEIEGDEVHLTNVIYNLMDNAIKYGNENSSIDIRLEAGDFFLHLSIADRGIGIPKEYQKKVFEKFFRVPTGDVHNVKGYGLGLNYVAEVIKSHHGTIAVESALGEGSRFIISLPLQHVKN